MLSCNTFSYSKTTYMNHISIPFPLHSQDHILEHLVNHYAPFTFAPFNPSFFASLFIPQ